MSKAKNSSVLCISDLHAPYQHQDSIAFLSSIKKKYRPDLVICMGDELDYHQLSFHDSYSDLMGANDELQAGIDFLKKVSSLFPVVSILESNHGSMYWRKAHAAGLPKRLFRPYGEVLDVPKGWVWHHDLTITLSNKEKCFFVHKLGANTLSVGKQLGMNFVQGHYHSKLSIQYWESPTGLCWAAQTGCSIDDKSMSFAYNKLTAARPIMGHIIILNGIPKLLPMILTPTGRWNGETP